MGSGSSKAKLVAVPNSNSSRQQKPDVVANVNKHPESFNPATDEPHKNINIDTSNTQDCNRSSERDRTSPTNEKSESKDRNSKTIVNTERISDAELIFEDDSDLNDNIDEVLKIPVAVDRARQSKDTEKNRREPESSPNYFDEEPNSEATLPETYVQRMQRQQYKFQHKLLLHDDEVIRDPKEWQQDNDDNESIEDSHQVQFDATKFRAANQGMEPRKDLFATEAEDLESTHFLQPSPQDFDDFDWADKEDASTIKQLPRYNQSELDLMKQLEEEVL